MIKQICFSIEELTDLLHELNNVNDQIYSEWNSGHSGIEKWIDVLNEKLGKLKIKNWKNASLVLLYNICDYYLNNQTEENAIQFLNNVRTFSKENLVRGV